MTFNCEICNRNHEIMEEIEKKKNIAPIFGMVTLIYSKFFQK